MGLYTRNSQVLAKMTSESPDQSVAPVENDGKTVSQNDTVVASQSVTARLNVTATSVPIPSPELLEQYNRVDPAIVQFILRTAENSVNAEVAIKKASAEHILARSKSILLERDLEKRGQWIVLFILVLLITSGTLLAVLGCTKEACAVFALIGTGFFVQLVFRPK